MKSDSLVKTSGDKGLSTNKNNKIRSTQERNNLLFVDYTKSLKIAL